jgi:hypothetical protein
MLPERLICDHYLQDQLLITTKVVDMSPMPQKSPFYGWGWEVVLMVLSRVSLAFGQEEGCLTHPHGGETRNSQIIIGVTYRPVYHRQESVLLAPCVPSEAPRPDHGMHRPTSSKGVSIDHITVRTRAFVDTVPYQF